MPLSVSLKTLSGRTLTGINIPLSATCQTWGEMCQDTDKVDNWHLCVVNHFPKTYIFITTTFISIKNYNYTILFVAMVTKFKNSSWLQDFVATETTVVLNNLPKTYIFITTFFVSIKSNLYTILFVAMVTKFKNLSWLEDFDAIETTVVWNNFPKTYIFITTFFISVKNYFYRIVFVAMVTKLKNLSWLYAFIAMETTVVLNNFQNPHIFVTAFLISVKNDLYTILFVAMVTKFNNFSFFLPWKPQLS